jgi:hypothetical protein
MQSHSTGFNASLTDNYISQVLAHHHRSVAQEFNARAQQAPTVQNILELLGHAITAYRMIPIHLRTLDDYQQCINLQSMLVMCPLSTVAKSLEHSDGIVSSEQLFKFAIAEHIKFINLLNTLNLECPNLIIYLAQQKLAYAQEYVELLDKCFVNLKQLMQSTIWVLQTCISSDQRYNDRSLQHIDGAIADAIRIAAFLTHLNEFEEAHEDVCHFLQAMAIILSPFAKNAFASVDDRYFAYNYHAAVITLLKKIPTTHQKTDDMILLHQHSEAIADLASLNILAIQVPSMQIQIDTNLISGLYTSGIYAQAIRPPATMTVAVASAPNPVTEIQPFRMT